MALEDKGMPPFKKEHDSVYFEKDIKEAIAEIYKFKNRVIYEDDLIKAFGKSLMPKGEEDGT